MKTNLRFLPLNLELPSPTFFGLDMRNYKISDTIKVDYIFTNFVNKEKLLESKFACVFYMTNTM